MLRLAKHFKLSKNLTSQLLQSPKQVPKNETIKFSGRIWSQQLVELMVRDTVSTRVQLNGIEDKSSKNYYLLYKKYESMKKELTMIEKNDHNGIEKLIEVNGVYWSESVRKGKVKEYVSLLNEDEPEVSWVSKISFSSFERCAKTRFKTRFLIVNVFFSLLNFFISQRPILQRINNPCKLRRRNKILPQKRRFLVL